MSHFRPCKYIYSSGPRNRPRYTRRIHHSVLSTENIAW